MHRFWLAVAALSLGACGSTSDGDSGAGATGGSMTSTGGTGAGTSGSGGSGATSSGGTSGGTSTGGSATGGSGTSGGSGGSGGGERPLCPAAPPNQDDACEPEQLRCSWGDDPRFGCRTTAVCFDTGWNVSEPTQQGCDDEPRPARCPTDPGSGGCDEQNLTCVYDSGTTCTCTNCPNGSPVCTDGPPEWDCWDAAGDDCPRFAPNEGTRCDMDGQVCNYTCDLQATCRDGVWNWARGMCPVCASPDTPIATPSGERPIAELEVGDLVYSVSEHGVVVVPVLHTGKTPVRNHHVLEVQLESGRALHISPGHPTDNGTLFSTLVPGDDLGGERVVGVKRVPYRFDHTYDILPASSTGHYFAAGALIGSTLGPKTPASL